MCVKTYRRSRYTRPSQTTSTKRNPQKQVKNLHPNLKARSEKSNKKNHQTAPNKKQKESKSVSFNEVVVVRTQCYQEAEKSVSFHEVVVVRPVLHLSDYTDREIANSWFVLEDKQRMKSEILNTLKLAKECKNDESFSSLDSSSSLEDELCCTRGLERLSGRTRERRKIPIREILREQEAQRASHESDQPFVYDHSRFRKIYKRYSRAARHHSHAVGLMDQMAVCENIWIETIFLHQEKCLTHSSIPTNDINRRSFTHKIEMRRDEARAKNFTNWMQKQCGTAANANCEYYAKDAGKARHPVEFHTGQNAYHGDHRPPPPPPPFIRDKQDARMTFRVPVKANGHIAIGNNSILSCKMMQNEFPPPLLYIFL